MHRQTNIWQTSPLPPPSIVKVFFLESQHFSKMSNTLTGPLRMYPAAEDNYGSDACYILCLNLRPAVIVIATRDGKLHHCLLLNRSTDDDDDNQVNDIL